ncbi:ATP synthase F1 subunit delta [Candidatus Latescibacterota bacterium]
MLHNRKIAKRYAKAFIHAKMSEKEADTLIEEMSSFIFALESDQKIREFFESPVNAKALKSKVMRDLSGKIGYSGNLISLIEVLIKKDRMNLLPDVADELRIISDRIHNRIRVSLTTAYEPSVDDIEEISNKVSDYFGRNAIVERTIDKSIIGGIVLEGDGKKIDLSIKGQLKRAFSE